MAAAVISRRQGALADASLRESEARYRLLFETSRDGIVAVDLSRCVTEANPAFQSMLGYTANELQALTYEKLTPPRWRDAEDAIVIPRGTRPRPAKPLPFNDIERWVF